MSFEELQQMLKRGGSIPTERRTSSHAPLGILNTQDEHEPHQAPNRGKLGFLPKRRNISIEAIRGKKGNGGRPLNLLRYKKN
jgi:hypothetical protein